MSRPEAADVDANTSPARHDFHHLRQSLHYALARVSRGGHDITIVESELLISAGGGQDASGGHELPSVQKPPEIVIPLVGTFTFNGGDPTSNSLHHLLGRGLDRLGLMLGEAFDLVAVAQLNRDSS